MCGCYGNGLESVASVGTGSFLVLEEIGLLRVTGMAAPKPSFEMDIALDALMHCQVEAYFQAKA